MKKNLIFLLIFLFVSPVLAFSESNNEPTITSTSGLVYNATENEILFKKNKDEAVPIDNLTQLMTIALLLDDLKDEKVLLSERAIVSEKAWLLPGLHMFLEPNHQPTIDELLQGLAIISADDAAVTVAEHLEGSTEQFVKRMNDKAQTLNMINTEFHTVNGSPSDVSSANDLLNLTQYILEKHTDYLSYFSKDSMTYQPINSETKHQLINKNHYLLTNNLPGLKSGWGSNFHLVSMKTMNQLDFIIITLGDNTSNARHNSTDTLLQFAQNAYQTITIAKKGDSYQDFYVYKSDTNGPDPVTYAEDVVITIPATVKKEELSIEFTGKEYISGGLKQGDKVGEVTVSYQNEVLATSDILVTQDYSKANLFISFIDSIAIFFSHILIDWLSSLFS